MNAPSSNSLDIKRVLDLWNEHKDTYDIAKAIGCPESAVYNALAKLGGETTTWRAGRHQRRA